MPGLARQGYCRPPRRAGSTPHSCLFRLTLQQTGKIVRDTGVFAAAVSRSTGEVSAQSLCRVTRGSCSTKQTPLHEVDVIASSGTVSF